MKIVYISDRQYLPIVRMSAASVLRFNPQAEIVIVSPEPLDCEFRTFVIDISAIHFRMDGAARFRPTVYLKLFLPRLPFGKVLMLDGDTICRGPLDELWNADVPYIGIVHSHDCGVIQARSIGIPLYGLTAVMLLNLEALRRIDFESEALRAMPTIRQPACGWQHEETIINARFHDRLTFLPLKWDFCFNRKYSQYPDAITIDEARIVHFIGGQFEAMKNNADA